ncbi:haloacid dehalogenase [Clostridia bacterium]|nr:haloacid dehalogenase [Clostridia bacterium]
MKPDIYIRSVTEISADFMRSFALSGLLLDLDNTLAGYHVNAPPPEVSEWLNTLRGNGYQLIVCSNSRESRVRAFCEPLGLDYVHSAKKPAPQGLLKAVSRLGLRVSDFAMVGDQLRTDIRSGLRAEMMTIMVDPLIDSPWFRLRRAVEALFMGRTTYYEQP